MNLIHANVFKKSTLPAQTVKILLPVDAIGALLFVNNSVYTVIVKKSWQADVGFEGDRIEATIQKHQFDKLGIVIG